jgi:DNA-binding MarR family transcriptional regulator
VSARPSWTFLSNHAHVVVALADDPSLRVRDLAQRVGITERTVATILLDLESAGIIEKRRDGRRNVYTVNTGANLRHPVEAHRTVADIVRLARRSED